MLGNFFMLLLSSAFPKKNISEHAQSVKRLGSGQDVRPDLGANCLQR